MRKVISRWRDMFKLPTLNEIIAQELERAVEDERQCEAVIHNHRFQQHMAVAKINALNEWRAQLNDYS